MRVAVIGAGAAGCFCALNLKRNRPDVEVVVFEAAKKALAKVSITGGGRCNLTNSFRFVNDLKQVYPRGDKLMKRMFRILSPEATQEWWEDEGVRLVTQDDECVFPQSQDAMEIVHTLLYAMKAAGVILRTGCRVQLIEPGFRVTTAQGTESFDAVVVTTGGSPQAEGLRFLSPFHLHVETPIPSLFTVNIKDKALTGMMGAVVENTTTSIPGTKFRASGPLLITHWGMSGPAILKLTAHAARFLSEKDYRFTLSVNWMGGANEEEVRQELAAFTPSSKQIANLYPTCFTGRLWEYLLNKSSISPDTRWNTLNKKEYNRLMAHLTADTYPVDGQSKNKDEFVTCGGIALSNIDINTLEAKQHPGLFLAGEVLDVDGITGGFNLQAAWSMGFCIAQTLSKI